MHDFAGCRSANDNYQGDNGSHTDFFFTINFFVIKGIMLMIKESLLTTNIGVLMLINCTYPLTIPSSSPLVCGPLLLTNKIRALVYALLLLDTRCITKLFGNLNTADGNPLADTNWWF